jgi:hypothetical protein
VTSSRKIAYSPRSLVFNALATRAPPSARRHEHTIARLTSADYSPGVCRNTIPATDNLYIFNKYIRPESRMSGLAGQPPLPKRVGNHALYLRPYRRQRAAYRVHTPQYHGACYGAVFPGMSAGAVVA